MQRTVSKLGAFARAAEGNTQGSAQILGRKTSTWDTVYTDKPTRLCILLLVYLWGDCRCLVWLTAKAQAKEYCSEFGHGLQTHGTCMKEVTCLSVSDEK